MMKSVPGWELYRSFLAVIRLGSLSGAARALTLTQPTLGRHIDMLEAALDLPLFTRSQHGLSPTQAALALIPHAEAMATASEALLRAASGAAEEERGTVRLTASDLVGGNLLPAILTRFRERHPGIILELALSNRTEDLLRRDADIAIRMVRPVQSALVARRLGTVSLHLYAHRRYVDRYGVPDSLAALADHTLIGFDRDDGPTRAITVAGIAVTRELFAIRCDNDLAQWAMLRAGLGILACQDVIARHDPDLVPILRAELGFELEMWLAMHEDLRASRRVRLLYDHLAEELTALLAG
jgi:DNA-binding transcriptional LysR family regulator